MIRLHARAALAAAVMATSAALSLHASAAEKIVGLPCEGCEAVFEGLPSALTSRARIANQGERGEPLLIEGTVRNRAGKPQPGVIVYAYQTDATGIYPRDAKRTGAAARHGALRGWAVSDAEGRYAFETVRPGGYPGTDIPQHVHMHVIERGRCTYYIDDIVFTDDARLTEAQRKRHDAGRGASGVATPAQRGGQWRATRDIALGLNVPGYESCR